MIKIETKIAFEDYRKLVFICTYRKPIMLVTLLVWSGVFIWGLFTLDIPSLLILLFFFSMLQIVIHFSSKKHYKTNKALQEKIVYEFTEEKMLVTGESFYSEIKWEKIYKIEELKDWVLIYQSNSTANVIPRQAFGNQIEEFRKLVKNKKI